MSGKYTAAQAKATKKYLRGIGDCRLRVSKEDKERYMSAAKAAGLSLNAFIIQALEEKLERQEEH